MNKSTKIIVILMLTTIIIYIVVGIFRTNENKLKQESNQSGDLLNSGEIKDEFEKNQDRISYEIISGDSEIVVKAVSEGSISTTVFKFENDKLETITLSEEIVSGDDELINDIYNHMKSNENMAMIYTTIERNGNIITAVLKDEYVASYGEANKNEVYQELMTSLKLSE